MTRIEEVLCGKLGGPGSILLSKALFQDRRIVLGVVRPETNSRVQVEFGDATIEAWSFDEDEAINWPLDIIGFDCYERKNRWQFVVNCFEMEFVWESEWPIDVVTAES